MNESKIKQAMEMLITAIGDDLSRPGLLETPQRATKMFMEMLEGMNYTNQQIADMFAKCFDDTKENDWVIVKDINIFSFCEHHFALMYNMKAHIAYKPKGKVIGLSKIARIAEMAAKRLQLQERIGSDIAEILELVLGTPDILVIIEGEHSCMSARGARAQGAKTRSLVAGGIFSTNPQLKLEILSQI